MPYNALCTLRNGHIDGINAIAFSPCGRYLVSGGSDQFFIIWGVKGELFHKLQLGSAIISVVWKNKSAVFLGCENGKLYLCENLLNRTIGRKKEVFIGADAPVYTLDFEKTSDSLAVGTGSEVQVVSKVSWKTYETFLVMPGPPRSQLPDESEDCRIRPRSVHLLPGGSQLVVAYLNHGIVCWDVKTRTKLWCMGGNSMSSPMSPLGGTALSPDSTNVLIYNLRDGMDLYALGSNIPFKSYKFPAPLKESYLASVAFLNLGNELACGSPSGHVPIWDTATGEVQQTLGHNGHCVQAICAYQQGEHSMLAAATSQCGDDAFVRVWWSGPTQDPFDSILPRFLIMTIKWKLVGGVAFCGVFVSWLIMSEISVVAKIQSLHSMFGYIFVQLRLLVYRALKQFLRVIFASLLDDH